MSRYDIAVRLCRRALRYLENAKDSLGKGMYDVSATNCEISAQLLLKSTILFLGSNYPETHNLRELLGVIDSLAPELNIKEFTRRFRRELRDVESNRVEGQYSFLEIDEDTARDCVEFVSNHLIPLIRSVWKDRWCE
ncbi:MAG: HEPN domain-containing protein [Vulcanisaeta sp.]|nr:HEPN domain-containing protein [Vulcanisaeta sp.]MCG2866620.1 HEPN domain-containing protein [Vulcanisaeta sp.]MCG2884950.1 HEPN domain-containing protein [Vulcanisaeta sp.]